MRESIALLLVLVLLTASAAAVLLPVKAASKTIVVPDDYPTIAAAIGNATAGDTIFVKKGAYNEQTLTTNKTLTLKGESVKGTAIIFHPPLHFIGWQGCAPVYTYYNSLTIHANDVEISGFTISAELTTEAPADLADYTIGPPCNPPFIALGGAFILSAGNNTKITDNTIKTGLLIEGSNQTIAENTLASGAVCAGSSNKVFLNLITGSGIAVEGFANEIHANNIVGAYKIQSGIQVQGEAHVIAGNNITKCDYGLGVYCTTLGVVGSNNVFYGNRLIQNVNGIFVTDGNNNTFFSNELISNTFGATVESAKEPWEQTKPNATFYHNNFFGSVQQVNSSTIPAGFFDANGEGNYWSDYTGADNNGDGIGDTPYVIDSKRQDNYPLMVPVDIDNATLPQEQEPQVTEPLPVVPVTAAISASAALIGFGLLFYFRKRKHSAVP